MNETHASLPVQCWEEDIILPTYPAQPADPNPMFLEKRVYQGSSGKVYPNPFTDSVALEKQDASYRAIFLENEFVQLMILPAMGGRIHTGLDKTNQYDFFYRQNVIKPALVGLLGPWISGGVEFNWPQHHRPSTCMPAHASMEEHADGSRTVWLSEHDPMLRMKGMVGIHLAPGSAVVEARVRLYNRTPLPQTFLWWANVAVRVHDQYQAFFPPDVTYVADHAKRAITSFPVAHGSYYGVDYNPGTDITWYKNIPVPTSYMVTESKYDFFGGYDHGREAGVVHTSNHRIAPGKKMWTWGNAEFGYAWDRNLTDADGPYIELMAGAFTDNQPDFSWLQPYETRTFSQYWYPIQKIGPAKNANLHAAVNLEFEQDGVRLGVAVTRRRTVRIMLLHDGHAIFDEQKELAPGEPFVHRLAGLQVAASSFRLMVYGGDGAELIAYQPEERKPGTLPDPATEPPQPAEIASADELYLTGLHLEQYRHATRAPEDYWREGLRRDPGDARMNNAMGMACLRRGLLAEAEEYCARAVRRLTLRNPNPRDGEACYNLGLARQYLGKLDAAYEALHKCVWNAAWRSAGYYALAAISTERGNLPLALEEVEQSLTADALNLKARALQAALLRKLGRMDEALAVIEGSLQLDRLDFRAMAERFLLNREDTALRAYCAALDGDVQTHLDVAFDLAWGALRGDALILLEACCGEAALQHPMVFYTLAWLAAGQGRTTQAAEYMAQAEAASPLYCFPARVEEMLVLEDCLRRHAASARAHCYLGHLYYDKRRYDEAIACWRKAVELDPSYSVPFRNLGIAEFNILHDAIAADRMYARALAASPNDARVLYEWDQLKKRARLATPERRLRTLDEHWSLVERRDDLTVEYITLLNECGRWQDALEHLMKRRFSPWEGGEGLVSAQYVHAHRALALHALAAGNAHTAFAHVEAARRYPHNLGEGKHLLTLERDLDYNAGCAAQMLGDAALAQQYWRAAAAALPSPSVHTYFQALALRALNRDAEAQAALEALAAFAAQQMQSEPKIDYFATSLPNMLLFEDDLCLRQRVESLVLMALASHGLGNAEAAMTQLEEALAGDPNHLFAADMMRHWRLAADAAAQGEQHPS